MTEKAINQNYSTKKDYKKNITVYYKGKQIAEYNSIRGQNQNCSFEVNPHSDLVVTFILSAFHGTGYGVLIGSKSFVFDIKPDIQKVEIKNGMLYVQLYDNYPPGVLHHILYDIEKEELLDVNPELKFLLEEQNNVELCDTIIQYLS